VIVERLDLRQFRLYKAAEFLPGDGLNLVTGENGSGKSTLLEAFFVIGRGRSFRASKLRELQALTENQWSLFSQFVSEAGFQSRIGLGYSDQRLEIRLDGRKDVRVSEAIRCYPVLMLEPGMHRIVEEGPAERRGFLDWGVFHVEHDFIRHWSRYRAALNQRNRAIRDHRPRNEWAVWESDLGKAGEWINDKRNAQLALLEQSARPILERLLGPGKFETRWTRGWPDEESLQETLERSRDSHARMGHTIHGPHRAELRWSWAGLGKEQFSRGQQKLLLAALSIAQANIVAGVIGHKPLLIFDDFGSELSDGYQTKLVDELRRFGGQVVMTAFDRSRAFDDVKMTWFHVEHGQIAEKARL